jgi:trigger factor
MYMKIKLLSLTLAALMLAASLTACADGDGSAETGADSSAGTSAETETALPRHDYMSGEVAPDVTLDRKDYAGLTLTVPNSLKVEDSHVKDYIEQIRFQNRTAVNGTTMVTDQPLAMGDDAFIHYKGFQKGEAFEGGSNWDDASPYKLGLGSGSFIPGFESSLVGVTPNKTSKTAPAEIHVTFPADYKSADLAGKAVVFQVVVEYAVQYTLPTYNREFVEKTLKYKAEKEFYASDEALLEEFEGYVKKTLVEKNRSSLEKAKSNALWAHMTAAAVCKNHPKAELDYYNQAYIADLNYYYEYYKAYGGTQFQTQYPTVDAFAVAYYGLAAGADWKAEVAKMAQQMVERDMITYAIAEREGLKTISDEEYNAQVTYWMNYYSAQYGSVSRDEVIKNLGEDAIRSSALSDKVSKWLMAQNIFTFEDGTPIVSATDSNA